MASTSARRLVAGVFLLAAAGPGQGPRHVLWLHGGPERDGAFHAAVRELGFDAVNVTSGADPAEPGRRGLGFYLDQPAGKGVLELRDDTWRKVRDAYDAERRPELLVRPGCPDRAGVLEETVAAVTEQVARARAHGPLSIALADEASFTSGCTPLDLCHGEDSLRAIRTWLRGRHEDLGSLNRAWGTAFAGWDEVVPPTTDRVRRQALIDDGWPDGLRAWSDHREFTDRSFAGAVGRLADAARAAAPGVPVGLTGLQPPAAFGGHDYRRLMPHLTLWEAYDLAGAPALADAWAPEGAVRLVTLFPPPGGEPPRMVRARLADAWAHGARDVVVWSAGHVLTADDAGEVRPTTFGRRVGRAFEHLDRAARVFAGARIERDPVWLVESQPSVRAWWMVDSAGDGATWTRRWTSYETTHSTSMAARRSWIRLLQDLGHQPDFVAARDLARRLREGGPRVVVLPACLALSDAAVRALTTWVSKGGTLLADHTPALYDENLALRPRPALDRLFALEGRTLRRTTLTVDQGRVDEAARLPSGAAVAERGLDGPLADGQGDHRVHFERRVGSGRAVYLNLAVCEYDAVRLDPARVETALDLRRRVRHVLHRAGVRPGVVVRGERLPTCIERVALRARDGDRLLAIRLNALDAPAILTELAGRGSLEVTVELPLPRRVVEVLTGRSHEPATEFTFTLDPFGALFLELPGPR